MRHEKKQLEAVAVPPHVPEISLSSQPRSCALKEACTHFLTSLEMKREESDGVREFFEISIERYER